MCDWSFQVLGWDVDMRRIRSDKTLSLGMPKAPKGNIQGTSKQLSLGMPRKASPLSSPTLSVTSLGAIFHSSHDMCFAWSVILFCFDLLFVIYNNVFISYFNKNVNYSLWHAYFASIHVAVSKQKVYRCCKNSLEKS